MRALHRTLITAFLAAMAITAFAAKPAATEVITQMVKKIKEAPSLSVHFSARQGGEKISGTLLMSGRMFRLQSGDISTWFDGKTQWAYSARANEVNISNPDTEELAQINPLAVLQTVTGNYSFRHLQAPTGYYRIEMTPKKPGDIKRAVVTANISTGYPTAIEITAADGVTTRVNVDSAKEGKKVSAGEFRFNSKLFPGVEVVDLR